MKLYGSDEDEPAQDPHDPQPPHDSGVDEGSLAGNEARSTKPMDEGWSDRDIVLTYFPATNERLVPQPREYHLADAGDGAIVVRHADGTEALRLTLVQPAGNPTGELCCDLCQRTGTRRYLGVYRAELPGTSGRRYRYLTACRERQGCEVRRHDDQAIVNLLDRASR